ncbi:DUF7550 family protein [Haladaptatus halobius]|jgi:hypothetical protein|nr:hypothetical protein [Haladaptatus halobius]
MSGHEYDAEERDRVTAPQQDFTMSQVTTGLLVLVVGLVVTFGVPLLL